MIDPTKDEMLEYLKEYADMHSMENREFSIEEAIYWFACNYHTGQNSNLYSVLSTSKFKPGALSNGPDDFDSKILYEYLEYEYTLQE